MAKQTRQPEPRGEHQNVARAAQVIDILSASRQRGLRMTDVVAASGLGAATVHRLLNGLVTHGFVDFDEETNRYFVGLRMVSWTAAATERYGLAPFVDDMLDGLAAETGDTVYFSLISGNEAVCVDRREGGFPIRTLTLTAGERRPLGVGAGSLALLSFQGEETINAVMVSGAAARARYAFTDGELREGIKVTRERGYALFVGRIIAGMTGIGVPIRRAGGTAVAAFSVAAINDRLEGARRDRIVALLKEHAAALESAAAEVLDTPFVKRHARRRPVDDAA